MVFGYLFRIVTHMLEGMHHLHTAEYQADLVQISDTFLLTKSYASNDCQSGDYTCVIKYINFVKIVWVLFNVFCKTLNVGSLSSRQPYLHNFSMFQAVYFRD